MSDGVGDMFAELKYNEKRVIELEAKLHLVKKVHGMFAHGIMPQELVDMFDAIETKPLAVINGRIFTDSDEPLENVFKSNEWFNQFCLDDCEELIAQSTPAIEIVLRREV